MGQKINPLGFRLGTTQSHHSLWFAQPQNYSEGLQEDQKIRDFIKNKIRDFIKNYNDVQKEEKNKIISSGAEGIARIEIHKRIDEIRVVIFMVFPTLEIESRPEAIKELQRAIKELQMNLQKELNRKLNVNPKLKIAITRITNAYRNPTILAEFIAEQLKNRVSFRKAMKKAIELTEQADTKGIQVQIAGRLGGNEMARVEWIREGRVPLQTIRAKIDYCSYPVRTIYGVLGIKIWIFRDKDEE